MRWTQCFALEGMDAQWTTGSREMRSQKFTLSYIDFTCSVCNLCTIVSQIEMRRRTLRRHIHNCFGHWTIQLKIYDVVHSPSTESLSNSRILYCIYVCWLQLTIRENLSFRNINFSTLSLSTSMISNHQLATVALCSRPEYNKIYIKVAQKKEFIHVLPR